MTPFDLDPTLAGDTLFVKDLGLCTVRLMKDRRFPWALLVPRRAGLAELFDLTHVERALLIEEIADVSQTFCELAGAHKMNVAALGNQVRQLHVHVIVRKKTDAAWPSPVWSAGPALPYEAGEGEALAAALASALQIKGDQRQP